ncbi:hypothetical protein C4J87_3402 [Pseudomonas sp. R1-43-08]|uniref:TfuA-like protein n=1 Tax=Pseudomonas sp. R1-43-08 TaxID=1173270 RepID=UPI000F57681B|nr:TfuA-like protein [Pseudomonas sp. R1-43-08]AZF43545.1 hypothetical protein C4J87_3402 [Pseudomonas sp. R1-43-08]
MLLVPRRKPVLFGGPSVASSIQQYRKLFDVRPPVQRDDLYELSEQQRPGCALIIDGLFGSAMAISPIECIDLMKRGWLLYGASSMGALRAADCCTMGMMGVGDIFNGFHLGYFHSDSDVAVKYDAKNYSEITVPYVQVDHVVSILKLQERIPYAKARLVLNALKKMPWHDRYPTLIADHLLELFKGVKREALLEYLTSDQYSLKRKDARMATNLIARYYSKKDMDLI